MGMLPVRIDREHVVRVKDSAVTDDGFHYWLHLMRAGDDDGRGGESVAAGPCLIAWDLLGYGPQNPDADVDHDRVEVIERAMAHGFAAAVLRSEAA